MRRSAWSPRSRELGAVLVRLGLACAPGGAWGCDADAAAPSECGALGGPSAEVCNGRDDDCDGLTDQGDALCAAPAGATARCVAGGCISTCAAGLGDCDGDRVNGCETDLMRSDSDCGACDHACAGSACVDGLCPSASWCADPFCELATANEPAPRSRHTAVWTGSEMIIWGGSTQTDGHIARTASGGRYDPASNAWSPTTTAGAPVGRTGASAIWDGTEMIVWGGSVDANVTTEVADGGRYSPATDTWSPVARGGAPAPRSNHAAVWTGKEMIVWGGFGGGGALASGGRYDPRTDTWSPISDAGAPAASETHVAVWTGSEMIVLGGRYDPVTDTWTPIAAYEPLGDFRMETAVWTGHEMILWGGVSLHSDDRVSPRVLGARYDPARDAWSLVNTAGAPSARYAHTATWTGREMVVCGGVKDGASQVAGGRYDPDQDAWSSFAFSGDATARGLHTAVWTGDALIVWGGLGKTGLLGVGWIWKQP